MYLNPPGSWSEGQPNDVGGQQDCIYSTTNPPARVGDIDCDLRLCPVCQVRLGSVFQFSGLCQEQNVVDVLYLLKVTVLQIVKLHVELTPAKAEMIVWWVVGETFSTLCLVSPCH